MTPVQQKDLLLAILAMDSYNQDYGAGLAHGSTTIGSSNLNDRPESVKIADWEAAGFYAASYTLADGTTVISYRGTDASPDYTRGWSIALGAVGEGTQAPLALDFYSSVLDGKTYQDGKQSKVVLTGHSLGGLLAGYVAALSGTDALTFDHPPFGAR